MNELTDAQLVAAIVAGRRDEFAALYDRYGSALYDVAMSMLRDPHDAADAVQDVFLIAAQRLHQLREPERVRAWLFSVLRHNVYRRSDKRRRTTPTETFVDLAAPAMPEDAAGRLEYEDLARLVRDAAEGLDDRDRLVLELSVRQGLQGADLASALGVSAEQSYSLVFRMRERTERALGALVVARTNREACRDLDQLLRDWDGRFSVLVRKRVARHVDQCDTCESSRKKVGALVAFGAAPAWAAPLALRDLVLTGFGPGTPRDGGRSRDDTAQPNAAPGGELATYRLVAADAARAGDLAWAPDGFPGAGRHVRRGVVALVVGSVMLLIVGVLGALALHDDEPATLVAGAIENRDATTTNAPTTGGPGATTTSVTTAAGTSATSSTSNATATPGAPPVIGGPNPPSGPATTAVSPTNPATPTTPTTPTTTAAASPPTTAGPTTTAPAGPRLSVSPGRVDVGASITTTTFTVRNDGDRTLTWSVAVTAGPVSPQPTNGTLAPGGTAAVTVTVDRSKQAEGPFTATLTFGGNGGSATVTIAGRTERGPTVNIGTAPSPLATMYTPTAGCGPVTASISAVVTDESAIGAVTLHWRAPGSATSTSAAMTWRVDRYVAPLGPFTTGGIVEWWVRAVDGRGNITTTPLRSTPVGATCIR